MCIHVYVSVHVCSRALLCLSLSTRAEAVNLLRLQVPPFITALPEALCHALHLSIACSLSLSLSVSVFVCVVCDHLSGDRCAGAEPPQLHPIL